MNRISARSLRRRSVGDRGFSMIELLVALLVLSIGLLGIAALMATSMRNTQSANQRTQATNLAYEITEAVRSNLVNAMRYHSAAFSDPTAACTAVSRPAGTYPVGTAAHTLELQRWQRDLCYLLPDGSGRVQIFPTAHTGTVFSAGYTTFDVVVDICWTDDRSAEVAQNCATLMADSDPQQCLWEGVSGSAGIAQYHRSRSDGRTTVIRVCSSF